MKISTITTLTHTYDEKMKKIEEFTFYTMIITWLYDIYEILHRYVRQGNNNIVKSAVSKMRITTMITLTHKYDEKMKKIEEFASFRKYFNSKLFIS